MSTGRSASGPAGLLPGVLAREPARPLLTYYDDATGERVELSATTTANWVAKTANLLRDGLGVVPGERVAVVLPAHWQTAAVLLACWSVGAVAVPLDPGAAPPSIEAIDVAFTAAAAIDTASGLGVRDTLALSLRPLGAALAVPPPAGVLDYAREVPGYGDHFTAYDVVDPDRPALEIDGAVLSGTEVVAAAADAAQRWRLTAGDRLLSTMRYADLDGLLAGLLAPLCAGGSVVLCAALDPAALPRRLAAERITAVAGVDAPAATGVRRLR